MKKFFLIIYLCCFCFCLNGTTVHFYGNGYDLQGRLLFKEEHRIQTENEKVNWVETNIFSPNGKAIGEIKSVFTYDGYLPDVTYLRLKDGFKARAINVKNSTMLLQKKEKSWKSYVQKTVTIEPNMIAGHAFYFFLADHIEQAIATKKRIAFEFLMPAILNKITFEMQARADPTDEKVAIVELRLKNALYRLFVPEIEVRINRKTRWVISYKGPNSFSGNENDVRYVKIEYYQ